MGLANFLLKMVPAPLRSMFTRQPQYDSSTIGWIPSYPVLNQTAYVNAYVTNASVYTVTSLMAKKFAQLPRYLCEVDEQASAAKYKLAMKLNPGMRHQKLMKIRDKAFKEQVITQNDQTRRIMNLLNNPNPYMGQDSFYALLYTYKKLTGNSYVWLNRGASSDGVTGDARKNLEVLEMYILPSNYMSMTVDRSALFGRIVNYVMLDQGQKVFFQPEDVIHWKDPNPQWDGYQFTQFYGVSPLQPGMPLIIQDQAGRDAMVAMFQHGGARGILYQESAANDAGYEETPEQAAARKSAIDTKINNKSQKSTIVSLMGKWGYAALGQTAVDMELINAMDKVFQRICNLLGCNPQIFQSDSTFNNVEQARKDLMTNAIIPDACSYRDEENRVLLQAFKLDKTKYLIDVDCSDVPELQDDIEKLTKTVTGNFTLTLNEMREELGFARLPDPNMDQVYILSNLMLLEDAAVPTAQLSLDALAGGGVADGSGSDGTPGSGAGNAPKNTRSIVLAKEVAERWDGQRASA